jgi:hypothetical protein
VEVATVGDEGMLGLEAFLSDCARAPGDTLMQVSDTNAEALSVADFRRELARDGALRHQMGRYIEVFIAQMMQTTACNAMHQVSCRCARWLLTTAARPFRSIASARPSTPSEYVGSGTRASTHESLDPRSWAGDNSRSHRRLAWIVRAPLEGFDVVRKRPCRAGWTTPCDSAVVL